jgi:hypothetical protein
MRIACRIKEIVLVVVVVNPGSIKKGAFVAAFHCCNRCAGGRAKAVNPCSVFRIEIEISK